MYSFWALAHYAGIVLSMTGNFSTKNNVNTIGKHFEPIHLRPKPRVETAENGHYTKDYVETSCKSLVTLAI